MIRHHIIYAIRHLRKNTTGTLLNIFGLSIGLACFSLIALWVMSELSYDKFHSKSDRIYRVTSKFMDETSVIDQAVTSAPLAAALVRDIPEVESAVRVDPGDAVISVGDNTFLEPGIITDPAFFWIFDFKLLSGDRKSALQEPYSIVLSQKLARKYFGDSNPVGQLVKVFKFDPDGNGAQYKVTGIIEDCPPNSQFIYDYVISYKTWEVNNAGVQDSDMWGNNSIYTYLLVHPNTEAASVQEKLPALIDKYLGAIINEYKVNYEYNLQALTDIHLRSSLSYEMGPTGSMSYVIIFGTVGIIVLLLACINYINMSTAYATERFKEVGIHKVMGAHKRLLVNKYLTESWLLAVISLVIAFGWIEVSRPLFESISGTHFPGLYTLSSIGSLFAIASFAGLVAGFYPSVVLSNVKPVNILKGNAGGISGKLLRKILVVIQFSIAIMLVIGIIVAQLQMDFIRDKDLGFDKNNLVVFGVHGSNEVKSGYNGFVNDLGLNPDISGIARSNTTIGNGIGNASGILDDASGREMSSTVYQLRCDYDYIDVYGMKLIAGRNFRRDNASDSSRAFIVNESLIKSYGYENASDVVGKEFEYEGRKGEIIGVVKDFNFHSLQHTVEPMCMYLLGGSFSRISIRINGDTRQAFEEVQNKWRKHFPNSVLQYAFYEDSLATSYRAEARFSDVFLVFSLISLAIACLGLFALVSYTVERRSKEIGIRKVLGATVSDILSMLSREFLLLVALSSIVAIPLGYYFMNEWLTSFAYHISLNVFMFITAGALVLIIAWITVSLRTFEAASSNPVQSLRSE